MRILATTPLLVATAACMLEQSPPIQITRIVGPPEARAIVHCFLTGYATTYEELTAECGPPDTEIPWPSENGKCAVYRDDGHHPGEPGSESTALAVCMRLARSSSSQPRYEVKAVYPLVSGVLKKPE